MNCNQTLNEMRAILFVMRELFPSFCAQLQENKKFIRSLMLKKKRGRAHCYEYVLLNVTCCCRNKAMSLNVLFQNHPKLVLCNIKAIPTPPQPLVDAL